jgi:IAA-amino acid hydrolase
MPHPLLESAQELGDHLVALRRDLHRHPELAYREVRTARIAARELREAGFRVREGVARTGVIGELGSTEGPTVALRADMDALPIQEETGHPWASCVPGVMHACGHDAHTAILSGAARILAELQHGGNLPAGRVRLLFQPSEESMDEEGKSGALRMLEEGAMDGVDAVVGLHVGAHLPAGRILVKEGPFFAGSDEIIVTVRGRSAHGARPHEGVDAITLAAQGVVAAQQVVARRIAPWEKGVLTFGTVSGGRAMNVIPDRVELTGTVRYFDEAVRARILEGLEAAFAHVQPWGGSAQVTVRKGYPPLVNDPELTRRLRPALMEVAGDDVFLPDQGVMEAEDFSYLARASRGLFFWLGAALPEPRDHHHPRFDIDESVLPLGAALLARSVVELLERS